MTGTRLPPMEAAAFVAGLAELSPAKTLRAKQRAAKEAAARRTGHTSMSMAMPVEVRRQFRHIQQCTGYSQAKAFAFCVEAGLAQVDLEGQMGPEARAALTLLERWTDATPAQVIDFAVRYMAQELVTRKVLRLRRAA